MKPLKESIDSVGWYQTWVNEMVLGFNAGRAGGLSAAREHYQRANLLSFDPVSGEKYETFPELQVLRHQAGSAYGTIIPSSPTEDVVSSALLMPTSEEWQSAKGLVSPEFDKRAMNEHIANLIEWLHCGFHGKNVTGGRHVQFLSAGRSGTVGLYQLLKQTSYIPFHSYSLMPAPSSRNEMAHRLIHCAFDDINVVDEWYSARAAEWIGCENSGRPMALMNHYDTPYAPALAALHENARFVYVHRHPVDIYKSFFLKDQHKGNQVSPIYCSFSPYRWRRVDWTLSEKLGWYIAWTEAFCSAFGKVMGDRFMRIDIESIWCGNEDKIKALLDFLEIDAIDVSDVVKHMAKPINQKAGKVVKTEDELASAYDDFADSYLYYGGQHVV